MSTPEKDEFLAELFKTNLECEDLVAVLMDHVNFGAEVLVKYTKNAMSRNATKEDMVATALMTIGYMEVANRMYKEGRTK